MKKLLLFASLLILTACSNDEQPVTKSINIKNKECLTEDCNDVGFIINEGIPYAPAVVVKRCRTISMSADRKTVTAIGIDSDGNTWEYTVTQHTEVDIQNKTTTVVWRGSGRRTNQSC